MRVTLRPRDSRIAAKEAEAIPLPREDTTPPVTKTNLVMSGTNRKFVEVVNGDYTGCPPAYLSRSHISRPAWAAGAEPLGERGFIFTSRGRGTGFARPQ